MILHYINDDKFADYAIQQFANKEVESKFILVCDAPSIKYVRFIENVIQVTSKEVENEKITSLYQETTGVVFHGLFEPWQERLLKSIPSNIKVAWMFWDGEIFSRESVILSFLSFKSRLLYCIHEFKKTIKNKGIDNHYEVPISSFKRVDFCLADMKEEYDYAKSFLKNSMQMIWYNYYSIEETVGELMTEKSCGNNIFLGNSSTIENNHLNALSYIKKHIKEQDISIVTPLSYGEPWLRNLVIKKGKSMFGEKFVPLVDFMPRGEYNKIMLGCGIMIMNHYRPQAQGNIITGLWLGMRVFLSKKCMTYNYFKRHNVIIYSIEDDLNTNTIQLGSLNEEQLLHNRNILNDLYSKEAMNRAVDDVINQLNLWGLNNKH